MGLFFRNNCQPVLGRRAGRLVVARSKLDEWQQQARPGENERRAQVELASQVVCGARGQRAANVVEPESWMDVQVEKFDWFLWKSFFPPGVRRAGLHKLSFNDRLTGAPEQQYSSGRLSLCAPAQGDTSRLAEASGHLRPAGQVAAVRPDRVRGARRPLPFSARDPHPRQPITWWRRRWRRSSWPAQD